MIGSSYNADAWGKVSPDQRALLSDPVPHGIGRAGRRMIADPLSGALVYSVDLPLTAGRSGFQPSLALSYNSARRNGPFGWGWELPVTHIARRANPEIPRYREADDDVYVIDDEELVPAARNTGSWVDDRFTVGEYLVQRYRRRVESKHDRIERWQHQPSGQTHWRVTDKDNVTSLYGSTDDGRESDPAASTRTLRWLLTETYDDRGNIIRYRYKRENLDNVDVESGVEKHRKSQSDAQGGVRYLKSVQYGNVAPYDRNDWRYHVVFDYGEHDEEMPTVDEVRPWSVRPDAFSDNRAGFEKRMWRRCARVLMFHHFDELGAAPTLVRSVALQYSELSGRSLLSRLCETGYIKRGSGWQTRSRPALEFGYQNPEFDDTVHTIEADSIVGALLDDRSGAHWIDLHDEALPGLAMRVGGSWCFVRNQGGGTFGEPEAVADTFRLEPDEPEIVDLTTKDDDWPLPAHDREFQPTTTMRATANVNQDDPYIGYLDLNGDSADDVIVADERLIRWYPSQGEAGFGDPVVLKLDPTGRIAAQCLHADQRQSLWVADMTGDGLYDLVRIRSGEVSYWPHQGRGRFGNRIIFDASPSVPANDAGPGRLLLGDLTGSGTADLIWIDNGEIRYWENFAGASFGSPRRASAPGIAPNGPGVGVVDLFGRGADCIVWIDATSGAPTMRYISPTGDRRPSLLFRVKNGNGGETRCAYVSAAELRRRDREAGRDQLTSLPVPLQVVERIEHRDYVADTRDLSRYVFRHGAYDEDSRRFLGFAYCEQWQSGTQDEYMQPGLFPHEPAIGFDTNRRAVPSLRKTWRHTGVMFEGEDLTAELAIEFYADSFTHKRSWLSGNELPDFDRGRDARDAYCSIQGQVIREELYDVAKGTPAVPATVDERSWKVTLVQPSRNGFAGSFQADEAQHVHLQYDVEGNDPRINHTLTLARDSFGLATQTAQVAYGRRQPADAGQAVTHLILHDYVYLNRTDQPTWYRFGVLSRHSTWAVTGAVHPIAELYERAEIEQQFNTLETVAPGVPSTAPHKRIVRAERTRLWSNDMTRLLDGNELESKALVARTEQLAFSDSMVGQLFDERDVDSVLRFEGGYDHIENLWWAPGVTHSYSAANFYLPTSELDAVGRPRSIRYTADGLSIREVQDGFGNAEIYTFHPRTAKSWMRTDKNLNVVADRFDPLGDLLSRAVMGKPDEAQGDALELTTSEASSRDDPTLVVTYGTHDPDSRTPGYVRQRQRVQHRSDKAQLVDRYEFFDAEGRRLARSTHRADGSWLVTGYTLLDSCGAPVAVAQPFLSDTPWPTTDRGNEALAECHAFRYDILGRVVRIDQPGGTYAMTEYGPWAVTTSDANDNILDTSWYADRHGVSQGRAADFADRVLQQYEARAAAVAAVHANTPQVELLDAYGRVIVRKSVVASQSANTTRYSYDPCGSLIGVTDSRALVVKRTSCDLLGRVARVDHSDAGVTQHLLGATGEVLRFWDPMSRCIRYRYDANGRRTHKYFHSGSGEETLAERIIWGGGEVSVPDVEKNNLIDQAHMQFSSFGLRTIESCDWHERPTRVTMRAAVAHDSAPQWQSVDAVSNSTHVVRELVKGGVLQAKVREIRSAFDVEGRTVRRSSGPTARLRYEYGVHGQLERVRWSGESATPTVILQEARYDSANRLSLMRFGNGAWARRHYNDAGRLSHIVAAVRGNDQPIQDLSVAYDPNGNVTIISEARQLVAAYTYDGVDRLIRAEGRQLIGDADDGAEHQPYADTYNLDSEGNVLEYRHKTGAVERVVANEYRSGTNQLRAITRQESEKEVVNNDLQYDNGGHLWQGPGGTYRWDQEGHLIQMDLDDGTLIFFGYTVDGQLARRVVSTANGREIIEDVFADEFQFIRDMAAGNDERQVVLVRTGDVPLARLQLDAGNVEPEITYQLSDHVNSAIAELDAAGRRLGRRNYGAFGVMGSGEKVEWPRFGFLGAVQQSETALYYLDNRWFDPNLGRFIQPAPWQSDATNAYLFRNANPQRPEARS